MFDIKIGLYYCGCFVASCFFKFRKARGELGRSTSVYETRSGCGQCNKGITVLDRQ